MHHCRVCLARGRIDWSQHKTTHESQYAHCLYSTLLTRPIPNDKLMNTLQGCLSDTLKYRYLLSWSVGNVWLYPHLFSILRDHFWWHSRTYVLPFLTKGWQHMHLCHLTTYNTARVPDTAAISSQRWLPNHTSAHWWHSLIFQHSTRQRPIIHI